MINPRLVAGLVLLLLLSAGAAQAETPQPDWCPRPSAGSAVPEPHDLRSSGGVLRVDLTIRSYPTAAGAMRYCYLLSDGSQSPTLRLHPGDLLELHLLNALTEPPASVGAMPHAMRMDVELGHRNGNACVSGVMSATATNLHFHGLTVPPICHQDEVLLTSIQPGDPPFEYKFRIPEDEPPGLYWYHPHIHGFSALQVMGGASGALIIEGLERAVPQVAGLPERVLVIRDQDLLNPDAPPSRLEPVVPKALLDRDGDAANNGTGFGKPAKDLSVNFVPVPYPDYPPAIIRLKPQQRQLWRVLNASAITYLNLAVLFRHSPQPLGLVAIDGVPMNWRGAATPAMTSVDHIGLPPGARAEFVLESPPAGLPALLVTRTVDTGQGGENDPNRPLAQLVADPQAPAPLSTLPVQTAPLPAHLPWLGDVQPVRVRKLYFSEKLEDPKDPNSATTFYITVDGQTPTAFDPANAKPNIIVQQGDVEDWIIENRTAELHAFHIHQLHFALIDWNGLPVNEPFLRDTVNVPYFSDRMLQYPSVRVRMDFRDPNTVGTFVYHCHLLEHEDNGMMGIVRVVPRGRTVTNPD
ncbi:MAG TPA: multicopper oxidase domain-containing protein [Steroidobacteraceae bacterium]|nr:multicopper oxidase domain-containing protein [Steroidobacteraceae bacterium]